MIRLTILLALLCCSGLPVTAQSETVKEPKPQILAKVIEREFLYSFGLSLPGTLGVDQVRYQLEILDVWYGAADLVKGRIVSVSTPGGCEGLMNTDGRYLLPIELAATAVTLPAATSDATIAEPQGTEPQFVHAWRSGCAVASEASAQATIADLNQQRVAKPAELHLSAN